MNCSLFLCQRKKTCHRGNHEREALGGILWCCSAGDWVCQGISCVSYNLSVGKVIQPLFLTNYKIVVSFLQFWRTWKMATKQLLYVFFGRKKSFCRTLDNILANIAFCWRRRSLSGCTCFLILLLPFIEDPIFRHHWLHLEYLALMSWWCSPWTDFPSPESVPDYFPVCVCDRTSRQEMGSSGVNTMKMTQGQLNVIVPLDFQEEEGHLSSWVWCQARYILWSMWSRWETLFPL